MDDKKFAIIIHKTNDEACNRLIDSLQEVDIPAGYDAEILPVEGDERFFVYDFAMNQSDAKYKFYLDENVVVQDKNILSKLLEMFQSDKKIGIIGVSGAIELSAHGLCYGSIKRCGKFFFDNDKKFIKESGIDSDAQEVDAVDGFFMATQYDLNWRYDLFHGNTFGDTAQCIEFKREGYKIVVAKQESPFIWYMTNAFQFDEESRQIFLDEYSKDIFPLVTVIIPTFNRPKWFELALGSALAQTYRNIEIVVSDNSTNDETEKLIQSYLAADSRIKYFRHKDFSADDNWNFARNYNNPAAEYVNWLMDDDLFYPQKIESMVEVYRNNPDVSLVTSKRNYIDDSGKIIYRSMKIKDIAFNGEIAGKLLFIAYMNNLMQIDDAGNVEKDEFTPDNYIGGLTNVLIKKKFLRGNDLCYFDNEKGFYPLADVSTWLQLLRNGNMFSIDEPLSAVRYHSTQATYIGGNSAIVAMCWAKLIKYFWDNKIFLTTKDDIRQAFFNWIDIAAVMFGESQNQNYHGHEVTALEDLNIAMAEALHNKYEIHLPPSVQAELEKFK